MTDTSRAVDVTRRLDALEDGRYPNVAALAEAIGTDPSFVRRALNLTLLAPAIIERVLNGMEGDEDALDRLAREAGVVSDSCEKLLDHDLDREATPGHTRLHWAIGR